MKVYMSPQGVVIVLAHVAGIYVGESEIQPDAAFTAVFFNGGGDLVVFNGTPEACRTVRSQIMDALKAE
jgi:hypothetical protein